MLGVIVMMWTRETISMAVRATESYGLLGTRDDSLPAKSVIGRRATLQNDLLLGPGGTGLCGITIDIRGLPGMRRYQTLPWRRRDPAVRLLSIFLLLLDKKLSNCCSELRNRAGFSLGHVPQERGIQKGFIVGLGLIL